MNSTRLTLLERLRRPDDAAAWSRFVQLYTPLLYGWARRAGLSEADAADLLQDVFVVLLRELPTFHYQPGKSFRAWLRTVLLNRWRTLRRRRQPRTVGPDDLDGLADPDTPELPDEAEERRQLVARALKIVEGEARPETWKAFREYVLSGRPPADVARELGCSVNVVYLARSRLLGRLRDILDGLLD